MKKSYQWKSILVAIPLLLFSQLAVPNIPFQFPNKNNFLILCVTIVLYFLLTNFKSKGKLIWNAAVTILLLGAVICVLKPIQFGLDEEAHLKTTIRIADSSFLRHETDDLKDYDQVFKYDILRNPHEYKGLEDWHEITHKKSEISGAVTGISNPSFLPSVIGWKLGKLFSDKIFVSYYLGRIFTIIAYAGLVILAMKVSRYYREVIYMISTFPAMIFVCAGFHYDYLYFGLSLLILALLTNFLKEKKSVGLKEVCQFLLVALLFAFPKFPFVLVGSLIFLLPKTQYKNPSVRVIGFLGFLLEMIIALMYYLNETLFKLFGSNPTAGVNIGDSAEKATITYFMRHPLPIVRTLLDALPATLNSFTRPLSYAAYDSKFLESISMMIFFILIVLVSLLVQFRIKIEIKIIMSAMLLVISCLVIYAISGDTRVYNIGNLIIGGVQGRYYYFMVGILPLFLSQPLRELFNINDENSIQDRSDKSVQFMQASIAYLNVFTLGVALYTQIPYFIN